MYKMYHTINGNDQLHTIEKIRRLICYWMLIN